MSVSSNTKGAGDGALSPSLISTAARASTTTALRDIPVPTQLTSAVYTVLWSNTRSERVSVHLAETNTWFSINTAIDQLFRCILNA